MKVSQLRKFLSDVTSFVEASGAGAKILGDLDKASRCLDAFAEMPIEQFATFLAVAEEYRRTGTVAAFLNPPSTKTKPAKKPAGPKVAKLKGPEGIQAAIDRYDAFYAQAGRKELTNELIEAEMAWLDAVLDKAALIKVAKQIGVAKKMTTKGDALDALKSRALSYMETAINTSFA